MSGWLPKGSRMGQQGIGPDGQQGRGKPRNNPWQGGKNNSGDIMRRLKLTQDDLARPDLNQPEMRTPSLPGHYNFQEDQASRDWDKRMAEQSAAFRQSIAKAKLEQVGQPGFWQNPASVVRWHNALQAGQEAPDWLKGHEEDVGLVYRYMQERNGYKPPQEWKFLNINDPMVGALNYLPTPPSEMMTRNERDIFASPDAVKAGKATWSDLAPDVRASVLSDPKFYESGLEEYSAADREMILADPNFDWEQLPKWQHWVYGIVSNPKIMNSPMALAGWNAGSVGGLPGKVVGAVAGYGFGLLSGQQYNPTGGLAEQPTAAAKGMYILNFLSESTEREIGAQSQALTDEGFGYGSSAAEWDAARDAGRITYGSSAFAWLFENLFPAAEELSPTRMINQLRGKDVDEIGFAKSGEGFLLGQSLPTDKVASFEELTGKKLDRNGGNAQVLNLARDWILEETAKGADPKVLAMQLMNWEQETVGGMTSDLALQTFADPLNEVGKVESAGISKIAEWGGHEVAAEAFRGQHDVMHGVEEYSSRVRTGHVPEGFKYSEMGAMAKMFAGISVDEAGIPTRRAGVFNAASLNAGIEKPKAYLGLNPKWWRDYVLTLTPEARARTGLRLASENFGAMLTMFDNADDFAAFFDRVAHGDLETAREMSAKFVESPEFYTILPGMKGFDMESQLALWKSTEPARGRMYQIAEALGMEDVWTLRDELGKAGGAERIMKRIEQAKGESGALSLLRDAIKNEEFGVEDLGRLGEIFNNESGAPLSYGEWGAVTNNALTNHFADWAVDHFELGPETGIPRLAQTLKKAQSIMLLGFNPAYAMNNVINNMVTRVATGNFGYMSPKHINEFIERIGIEPYRMNEGVGMFGDALRQADAGSPESKIIKATQGQGLLNKVDGVLKTVGDKTGPFAKLSGAMEGFESKQAFVVGIKKAWSSIWREGKGYRRMSKELAAAIDARVPGGSQIVREAVAAGMNMGEIERAVGKGERAVRARNLIDTVSKDVRDVEMLDQLGLLDAIDRYVQGTTDERGIVTAFEAVRKKAQDQIDVKLADEYRYKIEHDANRLKAEGPRAFLDLFAENQLDLLERWLGSYDEFGEIAEQMSMIEDRPDLQHALWSQGYEDQLRGMRRVNHNIYRQWEAMVEGFGMTDNPQARSLLAKLAESNQIWEDVFEFRKEEHNNHKPSERVNLQDDIKRDESFARVDAAFKKAFEESEKLNVEIGREISAIIEMQYGAEAGDLAKQIWVESVEKRKSMTDLLQKKRAEFREMGSAERRAAKKAFYQGEYLEEIRSLQYGKAQGAIELDRKISGRRGSDESGGAPVSPDPKAPVGGGEGGGRVTPEAEAFIENATKAGAMPAFVTNNLKRIASENGISVSDNMTASDILRALQEKKSGQVAGERGRAQDGVIGRNVPSADRVAAYFDDSPDPETAAREQGIYEIAHEYGIASANEDGSIKPGAQIHIENIVRKYGFLGDRQGFKDLTPERVRAAFEERQRVQDLQTSYLDPEMQTMAAQASEQVPEPQVEAKDLGLEGMDEVPVPDENPLRVKLREGHLAELPNGARSVMQDMFVQMESLVRDGEAGYRAHAVIDGETKYAGQSSTYPDWFGALKRNKEDVMIALNALKEGLDKPKQSLYRVLKEIAFDEVMSHPEYLEGDWGLMQQFGMTESYASRVDVELNNLVRKIEGVDVYDPFAVEQLPLDRLVGLMGDVPAEMLEMPSTLSEGTIGELMDRAWEASEQKQKEIMETHAIAKQNAKAEAYRAEMQQHRDTIMNRDLLREAAVEKFGLSDEQADAAMVAWEGVADYWARDHQMPKSAFYESVLAGVERGDADVFGGLEQYDPVWARLDDYLDDARADYEKTKFVDRSEWVDAAIEEFGETWDIAEAGYILQDGSMLDFSGKKDGNPAGTRWEDHRAIESVTEGFERGEAMVAFASEARAIRVNFSNGELSLDIMNTVPSSRQMGVVRRAIGEGLVNTIYVDITGRAGNTVLSIAFEDYMVREGVVQDIRNIADDIFFGDSDPMDITNEYGDILFQDMGGGKPKAGVSFDVDGKALIHAFEQADFSSFMHESGHVFRRLLNENDLRVAEEWAGVEGGKWERVHEEKFARGFERYLADGEAPTLALVKVFESFKMWMMDIYKRIVGSPIDVEITPEMKAVFDRLLVEEPEFNADKRGQFDMFGKGEDTPLFSGTAQRVADERYVPKPVQKQETMFDMRPKMGEGLKVEGSQVEGGEGQLFQRAEPVGSPEFRDWFGDSKVVDEEGKPLVVYHGTGQAFDEFKTSKAKDALGEATGRGFGSGNFYFTDNPEYASTWAMNALELGKGDNPNVMPVYIKMENPIDIDGWYERYYDKVGNHSPMPAHRAEIVAEINAELRAEGYDGIISDGEYVVFNPEQIKSKYNRGTWDGSNPNILFQDADPRFVDALDAMREEAKGPVWYSRLGQVVESMPQEKMPAGQFVAWLRKQPGIKADEMKWTGFDDWLAEQDVVTREDAAQFIRENAVDVEEVMRQGEYKVYLTGGQVEYFSSLEDARNRIAEEVDWAEGSVSVLDDGEYVTVRDSEGNDIFWAAEHEDGHWYDEFDEFFYDKEDVLDKAEELKDINIKAWLDEISDPDDLEYDEDSVKYDFYVLPGGENYHELLFTLPEINTEYYSQHWDEPNVLAHTRFNERVDAEGKRVLFVEEVQSDWHQQGRDKGYRTRYLDNSFSNEAEARKAARQINEIDAEYWRSYESRKIAQDEMDAFRKAADRIGGMYEFDGKSWRLLDDRNHDVVNAEIDRLRKLRKELENEKAKEVTDARDAGVNWMEFDSLPKQKRLQTELRYIDTRLDQLSAKLNIPQSGVPDAPFAKTWYELVMKRMLRYAAENGFDKVAWTPGEVQAERYDLAKQVDAIRTEESGGKYTVEAMKDGGTLMKKEGLSQEQLADMIGKDLANKIVNADHEGGVRVWENEDLTVGGQGMIEFYDRILPRFMNKYGKKWGAKVGVTTLDGGVDVLALPVTPEMKRSVLHEGQVLFQDADPRMPTGGYENMAGVMFDGDVMEEGWAKYVDDLLAGMQEEAVKRVNEVSPDYADGTDAAQGLGLDAETQRQLDRYLNQVKGDMATSKLASVRFGEGLRDNAMLNYSNKYGFDRLAEVIFPYQFWYTRSLMNWGMRALTKPAWLSNYARLKQMQNRYTNNLPERLRGKIQISAPWMPKWMGQNLYIDPMKQIFPFVNFASPFEQMTRDNNYQVIEAERILQEWVADGKMDESAAQEAAMNRSGEVWEQAMAESAIRREKEISNPLDFVGSMLGPAWYLTMPARALGLKAPLINSKGEGAKSISETPMLKTARAVDTVTNNTWAEPIGDLIGLIGKPEEWVRDRFDIPEYGEYGEYYVKRQVADMVADGLISADEAKLAMTEQKGEVWDQARERVAMELAMRIPGASATYAGLHEGLGAGLAALPASALGSGLLPAGELKYRGEKEAWDAAWKEYDAGNTDAVRDFFDAHPDYEAYLAKGKDGEEQLRSYLVGAIWDGYMGLDSTHRKQAGAELPPLFKQAFLDKETRSYESIPVDQLVQWAQMLGQMTPETAAGVDEATSMSIEEAAQSPAPEIDWYSKEITDVTDLYSEEKAEKFPFAYAQQSLYYSLPKSERAAYLRRNPELRAYWDWKHKWDEAYPELKDFFNGKVYKRIDTSTWSPMLLYYVQDYALTGEDLPAGAMSLLEQMWVKEGKPYGSLEGWVSGSVAPSVLNQMGGQ